MTKYEIRKELRGMFNGDRIVKGIKVCNVAWKDMPYMVIENEETFNDAKADNFTPIDHYKTQQDLIDSLYKVIAYKRY